MSEWKTALVILLLGILAVALTPALAVLALRAAEARQDVCVCAERAP